MTMDASKKTIKRTKSNIETASVTDEYILEQQKKFMVETFLKPLLFPVKIELNEGASHDQEQIRSFEIEDSSSSSAQQKCVNYAICKKKFPSNFFWTCSPRSRSSNTLFATTKFISVLPF